MPKHPVPKKKTSKARSSRRYKAFQNKARVRLADAVNLTVCSNCGAKIRAHYACSECGFFKGVDATVRVQAHTAKPAQKIKATDEAAKTEKSEPEAPKAEKAAKKETKKSDAKVKKIKAD